MVIHEAAIKGDALTGYAYDHPELGEGRILETNGLLYRITYEEYSADWDEWVDASRLRSAR